MSVPNPNLEPGESISVVFISYSQRDQEWELEFFQHLKVLETQGLLKVFHDRGMEAGQAWEALIDAALRGAKVAVLLVSANFLTSPFILNREVPELLRRYEAGTLRIMPVVLQPCLWKRVQWLARLQIRPWKGRPILAGNATQQAQDWTDVCDEIANWLTSGGPPPPTQGGLTPAGIEAGPEAVAEVAVRSSEEAGEKVRSLAVTAADDPELEKRLRALRDDLAKTSVTIQELTAFKEMHDELHNLEFQFLPRLKQIEPLKSEDDWDELERCTFELEGTLNHLVAVDARADFGSENAGWIAEVKVPLEILKQPRDVQNSRDLRKAGALLKRVLNNEPSRINERMRALAADLNLDPLTQALASADLQRHRAARGAQPEGAEAVAALAKSMRILVTEHDCWQRVETDLRFIEGEIPRDMDNLDMLLPNIAAAVRKLLPPDDAEALLIGKDLDRLEVALKLEVNSDDAPDPRLKTVPPYFRSFRRRAGQRFFKVDADLRVVFGKLASIGEPLLLLLRVLAPNKTP